MSLFAILTILLTLSIGNCSYLRNHKHSLRVQPPPNANVNFTLAERNVTGTEFFSTYLDHNNETAGTFPLRYFWSTHWYGGPGHPIILFAGQEDSLVSYTAYLEAANEAQIMVMAEAIKAAVILIEHRYWGESSPFDNLTTENLRYLTKDQNIADLTYFAENVRPSFDPEGMSRASKAPWTFYGVSYSGAITAWTASIAPGTFWAYFASSATVEVISDFWQFFAIGQQYMPRNCSTDLSLVIDYIDRILTFGSVPAKKELKSMFQLQDLQHDDDFAEVLAIGPSEWDGTGSVQFCDYIESVYLLNATVPKDEGVGLQKALVGYAQWVKDIVIPEFSSSYGYNGFDGPYNVNCFDTHNKLNPIFTDWSVGNTHNRQWWWMLCNEPFGYWQDGAPPNISSIVSRTINVRYWTRQCDLLFPDVNGYTYGLKKNATAGQVNLLTGGWNIGNISRVFFTNGEFDPWRSATVSSDFKPGGRLQSTDEIPVIVIPGGYHGSDAQHRHDASPALRGAQKQMVQQLKTWVEDWKQSH